MAKTISVALLTAAWIALPAAAQTIQPEEVDAILLDLSRKQGELEELAVSNPSKATVREILSTALELYRQVARTGDEEEVWQEHRERLRQLSARLTLDFEEGGAAGASESAENESGEADTEEPIAHAEAAAASKSIAASPPSADVAFDARKASAVAPGVEDRSVEVSEKPAAGGELSRQLDQLEAVLLYLREYVSKAHGRPVCVSSSGGSP